MIATAGKMPMMVVIVMMSMDSLTPPAAKPVHWLEIGIGMQFVSRAALDSIRDRDRAPAAAALALAFEWRRVSHDRR